jgi:O-methyltransferase
MKFLDKLGYCDIIKLDKYSILDYQVEHLLEGLSYISQNSIEGCVVELGCNVGETSKIIQKYLVEFEVKKKLYLYDSFEGLPDPGDLDKDSNGIHKIKKGILSTNENVLYENFKMNNIEPPYKVCKGWFSEISEEDLPKRISFVFLDGDLYSSTLDGLNLVWDRLALGGRVYVHDVGHPKLPGVEIAVDYFSKINNIQHQRVCYGLSFLEKT